MSIFTKASEKISELKARHPWVKVVLNKYFIAVGKSASEVRKKLPAIRKKYPDAFLVKIVGDTVTRVD